MKDSKYGLTVTSIKLYGFKKALEVFDRCGHNCSVCGSTDYLQVHHLDGKGTHHKERGLKTNDSIENLTLICRSCHGRQHALDYWKRQAELRGGYLWKGREQERDRERSREYQRKYRKEHRKEFDEYHRNYYLQRKRIKFLERTRQCLMQNSP